SHSGHSQARLHSASSSGRSSSSGAGGASVSWSTFQSLLESCPPEGSLQCPAMTAATPPATRLLRLGHSPDADDAFMFYALASGKVAEPGLEFEHLLRDIQTLNDWAREGRLECTAISVHAYAYVADKYALLSQGASMGEDWGPMVVAKAPLDAEDLGGKRIAVPG